MKETAKEEKIVNEEREEQDVPFAFDKRLAKKDEVKKLPGYAEAYNILVAVFGGDPELHISKCDDSTRSCTISSKNYHKLDALSKAMRDDIMGLSINFEFDSDLSTEAAVWLNDIFNGNPHLDRIRVATEAMTEEKHTLCIFKDETVQYQSDDRFVPGGYSTSIVEKLIPVLFKSQYRRLKYITTDKREAKCLNIAAHILTPNTIGVCNGHSVSWCDSASTAYTANSNTTNTI